MNNKDPESKGHGSSPDADPGSADRRKDSRFAVPDSINEEYYQISPEILDCFPRFRYPLNLYRFKESIATLIPFYTGGERIDNDLRHKIYNYCHEGLIFVSRNQHDIYTNYITQQLDLVILDKNLRPSEISEIFQKCFTMRLRDFFDQTLPATMDLLRKDVAILVEYIRLSPENIVHLVGHMHNRNTAEFKRTNVAFIGLALYLALHSEYNDRLPYIALGFLLADVGMAKIPKFVTDKASQLRIDERKKVESHPQVGAELLAQFGVLEAEVMDIVMEHHERIDGSGYPKKLRGDQISLLGRIGAVADSYCAMITERMHAAGKKPVDAASTLVRDPKRYDPELTTLLLKVLSVAVSRAMASRPKPAA